MNEFSPNVVRFLVPRTLLLAALFVGGFSWNNLAWAGSPHELTATYGRGVHAYFSHQNASAEQQFSQVIQAGSTDPRVYYFRAMVRLTSGRTHEAEEDMRIGAAYEARNPGVRHAIGKALERIQGPHRRLLEQVRRQARVDRLQQRQQQTRQRYEQLQQRESEVLRREMPAPGQHLQPSLQPPAQVGVPSPSSDAGSSPSLGQPSVVPGPESTETEDNLFGAPDEMSDDGLFDDAPEPGAADDFFGETPAEETSTNSADDFFEETVPKEQPADSEDDLFGDPAPADESTDEEEDPFATFQSEEAKSEAGNTLAENHRDANGSAPSQLRPEDKVSTGKLLGILGRVVGSTLPLRGFEVPAIGTPQDNDNDFPQVETIGELEFGPMDEDSEAVQASAELPLDTAEPVDDFLEDSFSEPSSGQSDTSGEFEESPQENVAEEEQTDAEADLGEEPEDDPFGDF